MAIIEIQKLSTDERLQLIEDVWESLTEIPEGLPLTVSQRGGSAPGSAGAGWPDGHAGK